MSTDVSRRCRERRLRSSSSGSGYSELLLLLYSGFARVSVVFDLALRNDGDIQSGLEELGVGIKGVVWLRCGWRNGDFRLDEGAVRGAAGWRNGRSKRNQSACLNVQGNEMQTYSQQEHRSAEGGLFVLWRSPQPAKSRLLTEVPVAASLLVHVSPDLDKRSTALIRTHIPIDYLSKRVRQCPLCRHSHRSPSISPSAGDGPHRRQTCAPPLSLSWRNFRSSKIYIFSSSGSFATRVGSLLRS